MARQRTPPPPSGPFRVRRVEFPDPRSAVREILSIGCDPAAMPWLLPKARLLTLRVEDVPAFAANLLKQEALAVGADAVVHRGSCTLTVDRTDVLLLATPGQLDPMLHKLRAQVPTLKAVGASIEAWLKAAENASKSFFKARDRVFPIGERTYLFAILNVTPDSFSDGGRYSSTEAALKRALEMVAQGADFLDVGGESTRPGHTAVDAQEEMDRVLPLIRRIRKESDVPISVDTSKSAVARAALREGADVVNDVWGLKRDPAIGRAVAEAGAGLIVMHNRGTEAAPAGGPRRIDAVLGQEKPTDILAEVVDSLEDSLGLAAECGVADDCLVVDPGIGFGVSPEESMRMIDGIPALRSLGRPVMIGPSRKSFIGKVLDATVDQRLMGTAAAVAYGIARGADFVRIHDVDEMRQVVRMADALRASARGAGSAG